MNQYENKVDPLSEPRVSTTTSIKDNSYEHIPFYLIRFGLAFVLSYAAVSMSLDPNSYTHFIPPLIRSILDPILMLHIFAVFEVILSLWLLSGKFAQLSAATAFLTIFFITIVNLASFNTLFRNVSIILSALALTIMEWQKGKKS